MVSLLSWLVWKEKMESGISENEWCKALAKRWEKGFSINIKYMFWACIISEKNCEVPGGYKQKKGQLENKKSSLVWEHGVSRSVITRCTHNCIDWWLTLSQCLGSTVTRYLLQNCHNSVRLLPPLHRSPKSSLKRLLTGQRLQNC